jgi:hypothetical protein
MNSKWWWWWRRLIYVGYDEKYDCSAVSDEVVVGGEEVVITRVGTVVEADGSYDGLLLVVGFKVGLSVGR